MSDSQIYNGWSSDDQVLRRVISFLTAKGLLPQSPLTIRVETGIVHLSGVADDPVVQNAMQQYCRRVAGVLAVQFDRVACGATQRTTKLAVLRRTQPQIANEESLDRDIVVAGNTGPFVDMSLPVFEGVLS